MAVNLDVRTHAALSKMQAFTWEFAQKACIRTKRKQLEGIDTTVFSFRLAVII